VCDCTDTFVRLEFIREMFRGSFLRSVKPCASLIRPAVHVAQYENRTKHSRKSTLETFIGPLSNELLLNSVYTNPNCTSQEAHHVSNTEPNRLMSCEETVAVCCENRTEHTDTLWAVRTSQEIHHVSATEPNRLMLCEETVAVCCENRTEHTDTLCGQSVPHRKHITSPLQSPTG
jgi:hypothetical protein